MSNKLERKEGKMGGRKGARKDACHDESVGVNPSWFSERYVGQGQDQCLPTQHLVYSSLSVRFFTVKLNYRNYFVKMYLLLGHLSFGTALFLFFAVLAS